MILPDVIQSHIAEMQAGEEVSLFEGVKSLPTLNRALEVLVDEALRRADGNQTRLKRRKEK